MQIPDSPESAEPPVTAEMAEPVEPPAAAASVKKSRKALVAIILLVVALVAALGVLAFYLVQLSAANDRIADQKQQIKEQKDLIDTKETFGAAMTGLLETASKFDGVLMTSIVPFDDYEAIATRAWQNRWTAEFVIEDTQTVQGYTDDLTAMLASAATEAGTNSTGTTYETVTDQLGRGFVSALIDDADSLCESDVLACVFSEDPYTVHFDAADAGAEYMNDWLKTGVAYHEFAHVLQMTNPEPTEIALEAFGGDDETMADCFALTYLDGWTLDHRVWITSYSWWDVSIGYGYACDDAQRQSIVDWYDALGYQTSPITQ